MATIGQIIQRMLLREGVPAALAGGAASRSQRPLLLLTALVVQPWDKSGAFLEAKVSGKAGAKICGR